MITELAEAKNELRALDVILDRVRFLPGTAYGAECEKTVAKARGLLEWKIRPALDWGLDGPLVCAVCGGTNVGKSTVFNLLAGESRVGTTQLARGTKSPFVLTDRKNEGHVRTHLLSGYRRQKLGNKRQLEEDLGGKTLFFGFSEAPFFRDLLLLDGPDVDSIREQNLEVASELLTAADVVIFVTSEEKYNDQTCVAFLQAAIASGKGCVAVMNKFEHKDALSDFRKRILGRIDREIPCVSIPWVRDAGLDLPGREELRAEIGEMVRSRAGARLKALEGAVSRLKQILQPAFARLRAEHRMFATVREMSEKTTSSAAVAFSQRLAGTGPEHSGPISAAVVELLEIPILDSVFNRLESLGKAIWDKLSGQSRVSEGGRYPRLRALERETGRELLQRALQDLSDGLDCVEEPYRQALFEALQGHDEPTSLDLSELDRALASAHEQWVDKSLTGFLAFRQGRRGLVLLTRSLKIVVEVVPAGALVWFTGGLGTEDLLLAPLAIWAAKTLFETLVGRLSIRRLKGVYDRARGEAFAGVVSAHFDRRLLAGLPVADLAAVDRWEIDLMEHADRLIRSARPLLEAAS